MFREREDRGEYWEKFRAYEAVGAALDGIPREIGETDRAEFSDLIGPDITLAVRR